MIAAANPYGVEGPYGFGGRAHPASYRQPDGTMKTYEQMQQTASGYQQSPQLTPPAPYGQRPPAGPVAPGQQAPQYGQQTAATAPQQPATGGAQIQTSITPSSIYTPQMTQYAVNQAIADNTPDLRTAMKQFDRPGVSRSAGTVAAALPTVAASQLAQRQAAAEIPMLDEIANQKHMLAGEVAREGQALELGNLLNRLGQTRAQQSIGQGQLALGNQQQGLSLLQQLMGGF